SLFQSHTPGEMFPIGTTAVLYIAIDSTGNRDTCTFDITVELGEDNGLVCPADIDSIVPTGACGDVVSWTPPTVERLCSSAPISIVSNFTPGSLFPVGTTEVIYIASDTLGFADTCTFNITLRDQEVPTFMNCPVDTLISAEPGACEANFNWTPPTENDNCGIAEITASHTPPFAFPVGETTVTYTAVDLSGNASNCQFTVRVVDDAAPVFTNCPDTLMVRSDGTILSDPSGVITAINSMDCENVELSFNTPVATDDCSDAVVTQTDATGLSSGSTFAPGTTTLSYTATDESDNVAACEVVIVVEGVSTGAVGITVDDPVACVGENIELAADDLQIPGATYQWTLPNGTTFDGTVLTIIGAQLDNDGTYTINVITPAGCTFTNTTEITVVAAPTVEADHNSEEVLCGGGVEDLRLTATSNDDIVAWAWTGPNGFTDTLQNPVIPMATSTASGNYTVVATTANGCMGEATIEVTIRERPEMPTLAINGGSPADGTTIIGCVADTFNLIGLDYQGDVQYIWNVSPNNFGFDVESESIAQAVITEAGDYTFEYSVLVDGCPSDTVRMMVNIEAQPDIATSILGATSCVNADSMIVLQAAAEGVVNWEWFNPDGSPLESVQNVTLTGLSDTLNGTYRVAGTTANGCMGEADLEVILNNQLEMPQVGDLGGVCENEELIINLGGNYPSDIMFDWVSDSAALNFSTADADFDTADLTPGVYSATVTANGGGCVSMPTGLNFVIRPLPTIGLPADSLVFECVAADTTIQIIETGEGGAKWFWFSSGGSFTSSDQNPEYTIAFDQTPLRDTIFTEVTGENGCLASESLVISFERGVPQPTIVGSARYCMGEELSLRVLEELPDSTLYTWTGPNAFTTDAPNVNIERISTAQDGIFQVQAQVGECISAPSDSFTVTVITPPTLEDDGYIVFEGQTDTLDITDNDALLENVSLSLGLLNPPFRGTVDLQGGTVTYTAPPNEARADNFRYEICYDACDDPNLLLCDDALVTVSIQYPPEECVITTLVTPNNDGNNDNFIVTCVEGDVYPEHELFIFNQWGDEVFQAAPYNNDWNGTFDGAPLPAGTYFYVFIPEPGAEAQKGYISLYR
ncbi:MAG: HYR domain-containing protein, partial [Bacteroidota bacterium]